MKKVTVWAETEAEMQEFTLVSSPHAKFQIDKAFVAKKTGGKRDVGSRYLKGTYFPYDLSKKTTLDSEIIAPQFITDLVQWCSPDVIISNESEALISIETTYHILTFNNIAQRIPRLIRAAKMGVPSVIFQKTDYSHQTELEWFVMTFLKASRIYETPCLAILFNDVEHPKAESMLISLINNRINNPDEFKKDSHKCIQAMQWLAINYDEHTLLYKKNKSKRKWLDVNDKDVTISIGVRDNCALTGIPGYGCQGNSKEQVTFRKELKYRALGEKGCVWMSKGTGGMDPYPGLVKMCEILLCYDQNGNKTRKLTTKFACLPKTFWWFKKFPDEIYYKLIREFSDEVLYSNTYK